MFINLLTSLEEKNISSKKIFHHITPKKKLNCKRSSESLGIVPCSKEKLDMTFDKEAMLINLDAWDHKG